MARTFNGSIWGNIGDAVARDDMLRREENRQALGGLLDTAKFLEKANANRKLREGWQKYFEDRKANADAAAAEEAAAEAAMVDNALELEDMHDAMNGDNVFGIPTEQTAADVSGSIWDPSMIVNGFTPDYDFLNGFDPNTASPEEIRRAQEIIGVKADGIWGPKSRAALKAWRG